MNAKGDVVWKTPSTVCVGSFSAPLDSRTQAVIQASRKHDSCVVLVVGKGTNEAHRELGQLQGFDCDTGRIVFNRTDLASAYYDPPGAFDVTTGIYYVYTRPVATVLYGPRYTLLLTSLVVGLHK